jgi:thioredoxin 1
MVENITDANFSSKALKGKVIVDFYAEWCGPCQMMKPVFDKMSQESKDILFFKIDVDDNQESAENFGVRSIPTTIFLKDGKELDRAVGFLQEEIFRQKIKKSFS